MTAPWQNRAPVLTDRALDQVERWQVSGGKIPILPEACEDDERAEIFDALRLAGRRAQGDAIERLRALEAALAEAGDDAALRYLAARRHMPEPPGGWGHRFFIHARAPDALALLVGDLRLLWRREERAEYLAESLCSIPDLVVVIEMPRLSWRAHAEPPGTPRAALTGDCLSHLAMLAWDISSPLDAELVLAATLAERVRVRA